MMLECTICGHNLYTVRAGHYGQIDYLYWCPEHGLYQLLEDELHRAMITLPDTIGVEE